MAPTVADDLLETLKTAVKALQGAQIPFALAGSYAVYARGGPTSEHDVDILILQEDSERALKVLGEHGYESVYPPEDWLVKAYDDDRLVDLIFRPSERQVTPEMLANTDELPVCGVRMPVLRATDLLINKLLVFTEQYCHFEQVLPLVRAVREQIDWGEVRAQTAHSPFAEAFLLLCDRLNLITWIPEKKHE